MRYLKCTTCGRIVIDNDDSVKLFVCDNCGYKLRASDCAAFYKTSYSLESMGNQPINVLEYRKRIRQGMLDETFRAANPITNNIDELKKWLPNDYRLLLYRALLKKSENRKMYLNALANTVRGVITSSELEEVLPVIIANCDDINEYREVESYIKRLLPEAAARAWVVRLGKSFEQKTPIAKGGTTVQNVYYQQPAAPQPVNQYVVAPQPVPYAAPAAIEHQAPRYAEYEEVKPATPQPVYQPIQPTMVEPIEPVEEIEEEIEMPAAFDFSRPSGGVQRIDMTPTKPNFPRIGAKYPQYGDVLRDSLYTDEVKDFHGSEEDFIVEDGLVIDFLGENKTIICLPKSARKIDIVSFADVAEQLRTMYISYDLDDAEEGMFNSYSALEELIVNPKNVRYKSIDKVLYSKNGDLLVHFPVRYKANGYKIPLGVKAISAETLSYCDNLAAVFMPDTVVRLGANALTDCASLSLLRLSSGLVEISEGCISRLPKLASLWVPEGINIIKSGAMCELTSCKEIVFPASLSRIDSGALLGNNVLEKVFFKSAQPPKLNGVTFGGAQIFVPQEKIDYYKRTWADLAGRILPMVY